MVITSDMMIFTAESEMAVVTDRQWVERTKGLLKSELKRRNVSYRQLAEKLEELGVHETERNIANKIARGGFTAVFFVQCMIAIGVTTVRLAEA